MPSRRIDVQQIVESRNRSMPWKDHSVIAKAFRLARLRHKLRASLRQRGWAKTFRQGWYKLRSSLNGNTSSTYRQWRKESRRTGLAESLQQGWRKVQRRLGLVSSDAYQNWILEVSPRFDDLAAAAPLGQEHAGAAANPAVDHDDRLFAGRHRTDRAQPAAADLRVLESDPRRVD